MSEQSPYVIALTGGIASGKSAVSDRFGELGVTIIDSDQIARELVEPGKPILRSITLTFGEHLIDELGRLKRRLLRQIVFKDDLSRRKLEDLMHPAIREEARRRAVEQDAPYCMMVIPLLAETGVPDHVSRVLVVDTTTESQVERVTQRDSVNNEEAQAILNAQASREERLAIADDVINNNGGLEDLDRAVMQLHDKYLVLAAQHRAGSAGQDNLP